MKTFAFISYARSDGSTIANEVQRQLEAYVVPRKLVGQENPIPDGKYIRRVFVDTSDLSVTASDFTEEIKKNLRESEYLNFILKMFKLWKC